MDFLTSSPSSNLTDAFIPVKEDVTSREDVISPPISEISSSEVSSSSEISPESSSSSTTSSTSINDRFFGDLCPQSFSLAKDVNRHKIVHAGTKPHLYTECPKAVTQTSNLRGHMREANLPIDAVQRAKLQPFRCNLCPKGFKWSKDLTRHKNVNHGETPHNYLRRSKSHFQSASKSYGRFLKKQHAAELKRWFIFQLNQSLNLK